MIGEWWWQSWCWGVWSVALEFLDDVDDDFRGRGMTTSFPLNVFLFSFFFFLFSVFYRFFFKFWKKKKKKENGVVSVILMAAHNWGLIESYINKNWKLEDWIDKLKVIGLKWKRVKVRESVLHFYFFFFFYLELKGLFG